MERTLTRAGVRPSRSAGLHLGRLDLAHLRPLWRYAVFAACLFGVTAFAVAVRLDVQQMRKDLHRNARLQREARILNDRLHLELDARRRAVAVEAVAARLHLGPRARIVRVEDAPR